MTKTGFNRQENGATFRVAPLIPFYAMALALLGYMVWLVPGNYHEIESSRIVPADTPPENIFNYLKGLSKDERTALIARERSNFYAEPLDRSSLFNLGVLIGLEGDSEKSTALVLQVANRSFRDVGAQTTAINLSIAKKNFSGALFHMDGLLRSRPEFAKSFYPLILSMSLEKDGLAATAKMLATAPPWRRLFMEFATQQTDQKSVVYSILSALRDMKAEVLLTELRSFIQQLFKSKDFETAYFIWLDFLSPAELSKVGSLYDTGFDLPVNNLGYGWNFLPVDNSELKIVTKTNVGSDFALNIHFSSLKKLFPTVSQYVRLDPGTYHFSGEVKTEQLVSPAGLNWRIACVDTPVQIGVSPTLLENGPWKLFEFNFTVPIENCGTQALYLTWASAAALDRVVDGTISFDNLQIEKLVE